MTECTPDNSRRTATFHMLARLLDVQGYESMDSTILGSEVRKKFTESKRVEIARALQLPGAARWPMIYEKLSEL